MRKKKKVDSNCSHRRFTCDQTEKQRVVQHDVCHVYVYIYNFNQTRTGNIYTHEKEEEEEESRTV